jgi:glycerol-3-phosphate acyltransferase PlsY
VIVALALMLSSYLIGSVSGSLLLGRLRGVDIRASGSGSTGGTNAFRTQGWWFALGTVAIDIGKGAATLVGGLAVVWPQVTVPALLVWLLALAWTGFVGLSTMLAGVAILAAAMAWHESPTRVAYAAVVVLFLLYTHRMNISRLKRGTEPRFERVRVLGRLMDRR